jgi:hypothetical protein
MGVRGTGDRDNSSAWASSKIEIQYSKRTIMKGTFPVIGLDLVNRIFPKPITGIIGYDLIGSHPVVFDYRHEIITIFGNNAFQSPPSSIRLKLDNQKDIPVIHASFRVGESTLLEGRILVDTGSQFGLEINRPFGQKNNLYSLNGWTEKEGFGIGGKYASLHGIPGEISFGNDKMLLEDVLLTEAEKGQTAVDSFDGNLGSAVLSKFVVIFDAQHGQIFFDPNS